MDSQYEVTRAGGAGQNGQLDLLPLIDVADVATYLLRQGLLSAEQIVKGEIRIEAAGGRHRNFTVISTTGPSYFLKQAVDRDTGDAIERESEIIRSLRGISTSVPHWCRYDPRRQVLITGLCVDAETVYEYYARSRGFPLYLARMLGRSVAALHWSIPPHSSGRLSAAPWIVSLHRISLEAGLRLTQGQLEILTIVQRTADVCAALDRLRGDWRASATIHGDLRWENCLVSSRSTSGRKDRIAFVDWEFAGFGDPHWDVAAVFSSYLSAWVLFSPITSATPPDDFMRYSRYPFEVLQPSLQAFWSAYQAEARRRVNVVRAVCWTGARLLVTALEMLQSGVRPSEQVIRLVQFGANVITRPEQAALGLLGVSETS